MAGKDLVYTVGVDAGDAVSGLRKLESAVRSTMREVGDELDDSASAGDKFAASIDRLSAQMKEDFNSAAIAAEELRRALKDAGSGLEVGDAITELRRMGVSFDEITQDADKFAASLKQLDDVRLAGVADLDSVAPGLATKLDGVSQSAESSRNALANMVGNSVQDVTGLGGALGVALGQLAEFGADAKLAGEGLGSVFKGLAGVALPIAGIALATQGAADVMGRFSASSERSSKSVDMWADALASGEDATDSYVDSLREVGKVILDVTRSQSALENVVAETNSSWYKRSVLSAALAKVLGVENDETKDLTKSLTQAQVTAERWAETIEGGQPAFDRFASYLKTTNLTAQEQEDILTGLAQQQEDHAKAAQNDAVATKFFGEETDAATKSVEELRAEQEEAARAAADHKVAVTDAADALRDLADSAGDIRRDAITGVFDEFGRPEADAGKIRDIAGAIADLPQAFKDLTGVNVGDIMAGSFKADSFLDQIDGIAGQMRDRMAEQFAAGNAQGAKDIAESTIRDIVASLGGKLTGAQVSTLLGLDDLQAQIDIALEQSAVESVRRQLEILTGVGGETPFTASIKLAVEEGTLSASAAQAIAAWALTEQGVKVPFEPVTDPVALAEAQTFMASFAAENPVVQPLTVDVDTKKGEEKVDGLKKKAEETKPVVPVDSNTKQAVGTMLGLIILAALIRPTVTVYANAQPALDTLNGIQSLRPRVPVTAYVSDYPSKSEIEQMIGRPRIPVDIVVGQSIRITGVRD